MFERNTGQLIGNVARKPELRTTSSGKHVTDVTVAVNGGGRDKPAEFIRVPFWEKNAENMCKIVDKGALILVKYRLYVKKDPQTNYTTVAVTGSSFDVLKFAPRQQQPQNTEEDESGWLND